MIDLTALETALTDLPLYEYFHFTTDELVFSDRIHSSGSLPSTGASPRKSWNNLPPR